MRVLWLTYGLPYPPDCGARMRDYFLIREIAKMAEIDLVSLIPAGESADAGKLGDFCRSVEVIPMPGQEPLQVGMRFAAALVPGNYAATIPAYFPEAAARLGSLLAGRAYDVFQVEHSLLAAYGQLAEGRCRTVLSLHNVAYRQYALMAETSGSQATRNLYRLKAAAMKRAESYYAPRYDGCVVVSAREQELLRAIAPAACAEIVDNGVDCEGLEVLGEREGPPTLLFVGVLGYPPNSDGIHYFASTILPLIRSRIGDVRLCLVGHSPPDDIRVLSRIAGVEVVGYAADLLPYYSRATAVVVPLRSGGGTRLKVLEAMALGRPVISTSIGCEGLEVRDGCELSIADDPAAFAEATIAMLSDEARRRRIVENARRCVEARYDWKILGQRLSEVHRSIADRKAA